MVTGGVEWGIIERHRQAPETLLEIIERRKMNVGCGNADVSSPRRLSAADVSRHGRYFIQDVAPYCLGIVSGGSGLVTDEDNYALKKNRGTRKRSSGEVRGA